MVQLRSTKLYIVLTSLHVLSLKQLLLLKERYPQLLALFQYAYGIIYHCQIEYTLGTVYQCSCIIMFLYAEYDLRTACPQPSMLMFYTEYDLKTAY